MDRRELFKGVAATIAASGVVLEKAGAVEATALKPALAIFETDQIIHQETASRLATYWEAHSEGTPLEGTKAFVLTGGLKLTLIDANGHVLATTYLAHRAKEDMMPLRKGAASLAASKYLMIKSIEIKEVDLLDATNK